VTDDPNYDVIIGGFHIQNTGFDYCEPIIQIYDKDKKSYDNGEAKAIVVDGRIVSVDVINNGTGYKRLPEIKVFDNKCPGFGAKLYPIMSVIPKDQSRLPSEIVQAVYCPTYNYKNLY